MDTRNNIDGMQQQQQKQQQQQQLNIRRPSASQSYVNSDLSSASSVTDEPFEHRLRLVRGQIDLLFSDMSIQNEKKCWRKSDKLSWNNAIEMENCNHNTINNILHFLERKKNMEHLHAESETQLLILPTGTNNNPESKNENNDTIIDIESKTKNPSEYSITDDSDTKIKYSTLPESILSSANVTTTTTFSTPVMSSTATIAQQTPNQTYHSPLQFSRRNHQRLLSDTQTTGFSTPILTKQRLALQQQSQQEIKNNYSPYMLQTSMQQQQQQQESLGILSNNNNNNNEYQQRFSNDFENNNHNNMPLNDAETYVIKKNLIIQELSRVAELMTQYYKQTKNLSFRGKIVQNTLLILLGLSMIGFFFNADRTPSEVKDIIYYVALVANAIGFLLTLLSFNWNYAEQEHNSNTTYRGLHHLHDYVSHQLVRNGLTTHQMDDLLAEMSSRLLLIRDSADLGTWKPLHI